MNKKAFTLIELLAVIVILGILSTFIVPSVFKMVKNAKQNSYNVLVSSFEENARLYVSRHRNQVESYLDTYNYYTVTLNDLKEDNLLKTPVTDPRTDDSIDLAKKIYVVRESDNTLSVCFEDNNCYAPTKLYTKLTDATNIVTGTTEGLHRDSTNNFYYYAGLNPKNWVLFNDLLWRIVKINSEGSIKIIYEGIKSKKGTENDGNIANRTFDDTSINNYDSTTSMKTYLLNWYSTNISAKNQLKVEPINWCIGQVAYSTSGVSKASMLSGECSTKTTSTYRIGLLSASEYLYASLDSSCTTAYKTSGDYGYSCKNQNYLYKSFYNYWTLTRNNNTSELWPVTSTGSVGPITSSSNSIGTRPVITLNKDVMIDRGNGTIDSPYTIRDIITVDKTSPVITMLGNSIENIYYGNSYVDAGATALDNVDGDITSKIIKVSNLNTNIVGTYTIKYIVSDVSGNKTTVTRIVNVLPNKIRDLSSNGYDGTLYNGAHFEDGLVLDGIDDYVQLPILSASDDWTNGFTVDLVAKWDKFNNWSRIFDFGNGAAADNILIANSDTSQTLMFCSHDNAAGSNSINFPMATIPTTKATYKIVLTKSGTTYTASSYMNGTLVTTLSTPDTGEFTNVSRTINYIGKSLWGDPYFDGTIYSLKITQTNGKVIMNYDFTDKSNYYKQ